MARLFPCREAEQFCLKVAELLEVDVGINVNAGYLLRLLSRVYWESRLYDLLLSRLHCDVVLVANTWEYPLRRACLNRGIPFIELQHGLFDADHPDSVPDWVQGSLAELLLPDALACYGTYWVSRLRSTRQLAVAKSVGNGLIDRYRDRRSLGDRYRLLFTSQGIDVEGAVEWLTRLLNSAPIGMDPLLFIKMHPVYDKDMEAYGALVDNQKVVLITGSQEPNVWGLLSNSNIHLSIFSACHFDAAALGVPSIVMSLPGSYLMEAAVDNQSIYLATSPEQAWDIVAQGAKAAEANKEQYACHGFARNMGEMIEHYSSQKEYLALPFQRHGG